MKRLLTFLGIAALYYGAFAGLYSQATFEPLESDAALDTALGDDGVSTTASYWYTDSEGFLSVYDEASGSWVKRKIGGTVMLYSAGKAAPKYTYSEGDKLVDDGPGDKYLSLLVEDKAFYRTKQYGARAGYIPEEATEEWDIGDGKIVDAVVQFVSANETGDPEDELENHDKIAVWLYADETVTNLYVTAADGSGESYNFAVDAAVDVDSWHRVTIRAIEDIGDGRAGFTVYIDCIIVTADATDYEAAMSTLDVGALGPEALELYRSHQLFRSRVASDQSEARKFLAVGFKGEGNLDDITIADFADRPSFVNPVSAFRLNWTSGVVSFTINGVGFAVPDSTASGSTNMVLTSETTISITGIVYVEEYKGAESYEFAVADGEGTVVATKGNFSIGENAYELLSAAISAANDGDTIMVLADFDVSAEIIDDDNWEHYTVKDKRVTIDLNGKTIDGSACQDMLFYVNGELSVCDSAGGGMIVQPKVEGFEDDIGIFAGEGKVNVLCEYGGTKLATLNGNLYCDVEYEGSTEHALLSLQGGYFTDERVTNTVAEAWYYEDDDYQAKYIDDIENPLYKVGYFLILLDEKPDEPEEIKLRPGDNGGFETEEAANNAAKKTYIVAPLDLGDGLSNYQNLFKVSVKSESGGTWTVVVALSDDAVTALQGQLEERVKEVTLAAVESGSVVYTGTVTPGIYYRAIYGSDVGAISTKGEWNLANENGNVTLPLVKPSEETGFYRLEADTTQYDIND